MKMLQSYQSYQSWKLLSLLDFEWDMKFYFLHMKSDEVVTIFKHPETINGNVKNLSKRIKITLRI